MPHTGKTSLLLVLINREWMIRYFALGYAIVAMRAVVPFFMFGFGWDTNLSVQTAIPGVWFLSLILAELYINYTRSPFHNIKTPTHLVNGQNLVDFRDGYVPVKLIKKERITWNTTIFRFELEHPSMRLCVPPGICS